MPFTSTPSTPDGAVRPRRTSSRTRSSGTIALFSGPGAANKRVVGYLRASTDEENQPYTLGMQEDKVRSFVSSQDGMELVGLYSERASAKDVEGRPELLRLLEDAASGRFDAVVVYKVDRWSRRLADLLATLEFLDRHQVTFASVTEPIDTTTNLGRMVLQMLGSFAEFERGLIVERVTRGVEAKAAKGLPQNSLVGYGLRVNDAGVIETDSATFGVVQRIFDEYTSGRRGTRAIATGLQEDGLPTPGKAPWSAAAVARILRNRTFIGELPFRDGWVDGAHPPLLDAALFEKAQRLADKRSTPSGAATAKGDFVLSGTVYCGHCGAAYVGTSGTSSNGAKVRYYTCSAGRRYGKAKCSSPSVPADDLETLVTDALLNTYADSALFAEAISAHLGAREDRLAPLRAELAAAESAVAGAERKLNRYRSDYEDERISAETYEEAKGRLGTDLRNATDRAMQLELSIAGYDLAEPPTDADRKALHATLVERVRTGTVAVRKAMFTALVARLEVHALNDVRPVFRLGGPDLADFETAVRPAATDGALALAGGLFASHHSGWS